MSRKGYGIEIRVVGRSLESALNRSDLFGGAQPTLNLKLNTESDHFALHVCGSRRMQNPAPDSTSRPPTVQLDRVSASSFALGHKAAATLTTQNMLQTGEHSKSSRLYLATFAVAHAFNHYGQMVEYLRMKGIVPPASRGKSD